MEMIRKYFTRFSTGWFRITRVISSFGRFYKNVGILQGSGEDCGVVSDCEELVGVAHRISLGKSHDLS